MSPALDPASGREYSGRTGNTTNFDCGSERIVDREVALAPVVVARIWGEQREKDNRDVFQPARQTVRPTAGNGACEALPPYGALWKTS